MGKIDIMTKEYMSDNKRFADLFNYFLYDGREVLLAEELEERDPEEMLVLLEEVSGIGEDSSKGSGKSKSSYTKRERDLLRSAVVRVTDKVGYVLLGLENQSFVDYGMPVRKLLYEGLRYDQQRRAIVRGYEAERRSGGKPEMTSSEFLSGLRKDDKLLPVITLTLYFGQEEWDGPRSLHEMLQIEDERLLPYIADYKINLVLPQEIEDFSCFKTELRQLLETLKVAHDKQKLKALFENNEEYKGLGRETALMIKECTGTEIEIDEREEKVNMCKGFADLKQEYIEEGFSAGRSEGFSAGRSEGFHAGRSEGFHDGKAAAVVEMVKKLAKRGMSSAEIAEITEKSVAEVEAML